MKNTTKMCRIALVAGLSLVALAGCAGGHGKDTSRELVRANATLAGIKSGNLYQQAEQAYLAGDLDKALKLVDQSLQINPSVVKSHVLRGRIHLERSDLEGSVMEFQKAEAIDPKNVEAQYYQGIVYERFQQTDKALEHYQKAAELEPSNPQHAVACAEMMVDLGKTAEAEKFLTGRSGAFEHNAGVRQTLGHIAMLNGDNKKAVELFNQARLLAPDDPIVLEDMIHAQVLVGQYAEAEFNLTRLLKAPSNKDRRDLRQLRARCLTRLDRPIEAREVLIQLVNEEAGQKDVESWIDLGSISYTLKDQTRLRQAATRASALAPERPEGYTLRALWQRRGGDLEGALASVEKAVERRGHRTESLMLEGMILQELGRMAEAGTVFAMVLAEEPDNAEAKKAMENTRVAGAEMVQP